MNPFAVGQSPAFVFLFFRGPSDDVLNKHHRTIDNDSEVNGPQTQQIGTHLILDHSCDRKEHRERDRASHDDRGPKVAEQQE